MLTTQYIPGRGYTIKRDGRVIAHSLTTRERDQRLALLSAAHNATGSALLAVVGAA